MSQEYGSTDEQMQFAEAVHQNAMAEQAYQELTAYGELAEDEAFVLPDTLGLPTRQAGFVIDGDGKADWALKLIARAEENKRRRATTIRAELQRWQDWQAKGDEQDEVTIERMTGLLRPYWDQLKAEGAIPRNRKSYRLPHGVLATRRHEVKWLRDDAALIAWAEPLDLIEIVKKLKWADVKKRIVPEHNETGAGAIDTATGEVIAGLSVEQPSADVFEAKADLA